MQETTDQKKWERKKSKVDLFKDHIKKGVPFLRSSGKSKRFKHRNVQRGKNWLKQKVEKRRYRIGYPVGWGSFSVVYFAKRISVLEKSSESPLDSHHLEEESDGKRQILNLPEFLAVKVVKIRKEGSKHVRAAEGISTEIKKLGTPTIKNQRLFLASSPKIINHPSRPEEFLARSKGKPVRLFEKCGDFVDLEMSSFQEQQVYRHFDTSFLDPPLKSETKSRKFRADVRNVLKEHLRKNLKSPSPDDLSETSEDEEVLEIVEEVLEVGKTSKGASDSWVRNHVPVFLKHGGKDDLDSKCPKIAVANRESESPSTMRSLAQKSYTATLEEDSDEDESLLAYVVAAERQSDLTSIDASTPSGGEINLDHFVISDDDGEFLNEKASKLLTNQIRGQVQSVMSDMAIDLASMNDAFPLNLSRNSELNKRISIVEVKEGGKMQGFPIREQGPVDIANEIKALRKMRESKFAIFLYDVVLAAEEVLLITEFAHIGCLASFCEEAFPAGVPEKIVKWLITPILLALRHLHENNMIHRDVKPSNFVLSHAGVPKLCDFGMIKEFDAEPVFRKSGFCGTEIFAPPEAFGKERYYSSNFDVWSVGISILSLVFGKSNPWLPSDSKKQGAAGFANKKAHKKCISYLAEKLEDEVEYFKKRQELTEESSESRLSSDSELNLEYTGLYKRLLLLEKKDIENPKIEQVLLLLYMKDMENLLTLKKKKKKNASDILVIDENLKRLKNAENSDLSSLLESHGGKKVQDLKERIRNEVTDFTPERRSLFYLVKRCLRIFSERPLVHELLEHDYLKKMTKSWQKFDIRIENKLLEVAITGDFSCIQKEDFGGPYFNSRGEFICIGKELALKIHERFSKLA